MYISKTSKGKYYCNSEEITEAEYNKILPMLRNPPTAPDGYGYRLTADLVWELYELPPEEETNEEATAEDYEAALGEMGVKV